ncbi:MAG TPA: DUF3887 domain-containing protein [Oscillatoriales cyanobacterium M59_W2019_021]|nr:DUF3887 domain-containing protein [Oscillatoriales cyanobacterium M4454_W2019_049]HIK52752.1 DUF3887 domain-containing protein [Oscillatoriales cyanobacterium M59_W2019_021]
MKSHLRSLVCRLLALPSMALLVGGMLPPGAVATELTTPAIVAQTADIQTTAEQFVDALAAGDIESAREFLNPVVKKDWSESAMRQNWQDVLAMTGAFQNRLSSRVENEVVIVTAQFENQTNDILVIFDESGQVIGFDVPEMN